MTFTKPQGGAQESPGAAAVTAYKLDWYDGSSRTLGIDSGFNTVCIRHGSVTGIDSGFIGLNEAVQAILTGESTGVFPEDAINTFFNGLPMSRIRVQRWGPTKAFVTCTYQHHRFSFEPQDPTAVANTSDTMVAISVHREGRTDSEINEFTGLPTGPIIRGIGDPSVVDPGEPEPWPVSVTHVVVGVRRSYHPYFTYRRDLKNTTNSGAVTWGGASFESNTILFKGMNVRETVLNTGTVFNIQYNFQIRRGGWIRHVAVATGSPPVWSIIEDAPMYRKVWSSFTF